MLVRLFAFVVAGSLFLSSANAGFFHRHGGCCDVAPSCGCEVAAPTCGGCDVTPSCGCEIPAAPCCGPRFGGRLHGLLHRLHVPHSCHSACDSCAPACDSCAAPAPACAPACAPAPTCCEPAPTCCEPAPCCGHRHIIRDLLSRIKARHASCCAPACDSCAPSCDSCGAPAASCGCGM